MDHILPGFHITHHFHGDIRNPHTHRTWGRNYISAFEKKEINLVTLAIKVICLIPL